MTDRSNTVRQLRQYISRLALAIACLVPLDARADWFLVVDRDGLSAELKQKFGDKVEGTLSADGLSVEIGSDKYPKAAFGISRDGCFQVGIQQGIDGGLFGSPSFEGTGEHLGESVNFTTMLSAEIEAGIEICPFVEKPFQLDPEESDPKKKTQRMLVIKASAKRWKLSGKVDTLLEAFCLDQGRATPTADTRFSVSPSLKLNAGALAEVTKLKEWDAIQDCVWAAFPKENWKGAAWWVLASTPATTKAEMDEVERVLRSRLSRREKELARHCPVSSSGLSASFTRNELDELKKCMDTHGFSEMDKCI